VFNALTAHFNMSEFSLPSLPPVDAVIHFAAYARNLIVPDNETFAANTTVIIASSETVYSVCFTQGDSDYFEFPLDEERYDCNPEDSYACSKLCGERVARSFARRFKSDIYVFRIGNVIEPHEYEKDFPTYIQDPPSRKRNAWSYIDARDLGQMCDLAVKKDGLGFQVFNATNDTITLPGTTTKEFLAKECKDVKVWREMGEREAPLSNKKIKDVLGFKEEHDWRKYVPEKYQ
jgi:nucleoside-diphosphate-sugar epimerase